MVKGKIPTPCRDSNPPLIIQPVDQSYTTELPGSQKLLNSEIKILDTFTLPIIAVKIQINS
jgi:hypothetical protein